MRMIKDRRVLIVDDDVAIAEGLSFLFPTADIEAVAVTDRPSAEAVITSAFFPVVLLDLRLGSDEEGLRLVESIRSLSPVSRIVSLTGYASVATEMLLLSMGVSVVLRKPVPFEDIVPVVERLFERA